MMEASPEPGLDRPRDVDEPALLARCRGGDTDAYGVLVTRYRERAYGLALRLTRSAPDAEEVAQDAFVSAWRSLDGFRGDAAFGTWLYRIVWRKSLDRVAVLRNRSRREVAVDDPARVEAETPRDLAGDRGPSEPAGADERAISARLERLIDALTESARAVVTLFYYRDLSVAEIATALGMPEGTVKTHLHRARAALREGWLRESEAEGDHAM
jgi:RNA polymerase sigma-70 factor (ECF subfamily)